MIFVSTFQKGEARHLIDFHFYVRVPSLVSLRLQKPRDQTPQIPVGLLRQIHP